MAETKKKSIFFVVALVVLAALIVVLAATLSACSGDDKNEKEPAPTETVQPEVTTEPTSADASVVTGGSNAAVSGSKADTAKQPTKSGSGSSSSSSSANNGGSKDNGRDKVDYIMNYGDNVEKGVETAADDFVGSLKDIGNAYDKGNVEGIMNTVDDFSKGLGDFLGGVKDSIIP